MPQDGGDVPKRQTTPLNTLVDVQKLVYRKRDNGQVAAAIQMRGVIKRMFDYSIETHLVDTDPAAMVATRYIGRARKIAGAHRS